jgi:hypothetical protein
MNAKNIRQKMYSHFCTIHKWQLCPIKGNTFRKNSIDPAYRQSSEIMMRQKYKLIYKSMVNFAPNLETHEKLI